MPKNWRFHIVRMVRAIVVGAFILIMPRRYDSSAKCLSLSRLIGRTPRLALLIKLNYYGQLTSEEALFFGVRSVLRRLFSYRITIPVFGDAEAVNAILEASGAVIIASPHYPYAADYQLCIDNFPNHRVVIIAGNPQSIMSDFRKDLSGFEGVRSEPTFLKPDMYCLATLRKMLCPSCIVLCNVDLRSVNSLHYDTIGAGIFRFAERTGTQLYGANRRLRDDGAISVGLVALPQLALPGAHAFIALQQPERDFVLDPAFATA